MDEEITTDKAALPVRCDAEDRKTRITLEPTRNYGTEALITSMLKENKQPKQLKSFRIEKSPALERVKNFLPQMQAADFQLKEKLKTSSSKELDIENIEDCKGPIIEMNLAVCQHSSDLHESSSAEDNDSFYTVSDSDSDSSSTTSSNSSGEVQFGEVTEDNIVLSERNRKVQKFPLIKEVADDEIEEENEGER